MVFENKPCNVYVKTNADGYITEVNSSAFLTDTAGWIEIDSGYGDRFHHAQGNYFRKKILVDVSAYCYKLVDGIPTECTEKDISEQIWNGKNIVVPTLEERVKTLENGTKEIKRLVSTVIGKAV